MLNNVFFLIFFYFTLTVVVGINKDFIRYYFTSIKPVTDDPHNWDENFRLQRAPDNPPPHLMCEGFLMLLLELK